MPFNDDRARIKKEWDDLWGEVERMREAYEVSIRDGLPLEHRELLRLAWAQATDRWADAVGGPHPSN
jgi:hypothetical protein